MILVERRVGRLTCWECQYTPEELAAIEARVEREHEETRRTVARLREALPRLSYFEPKRPGPPVETRVIQRRIDAMVEAALGRRDHGRH